jgi:hypothetical protein
VSTGWAAVFAADRYWRRRWGVRGPGAAAGRAASAHFRRRIRFFRTVPAPLWEELISTAEECRGAGGPIQYLGLQDPDYVDRLTASFSWDLSGPQVFERLMRVRHLLGRPVATCADPEFTSAENPVAELLTRVPADPAPR